MERLRSGIAEGDALWNEQAAKLHPGELACRGGCFGCCLGLFEISMAEAMVALEGVRRLAPDERAEVTARARRIADRSRALYPGDAESGLLDPERTEEEDDRYFDAEGHTACPMLELPSGRCRIYEHRPITCRTFGLAWMKGGRSVHPACNMNFPLDDARARETGIDVRRIMGIDAELGAYLNRQGLPGGAETTLAHAVTGTAFTSPRPWDRSRRSPG
jgi:Fe-S-cluster containining protein